MRLARCFSFNDDLNGWSGGQFSFIRFVIGIVLAINSITALCSFSPIGLGFYFVLFMSSCAFALGYKIQETALFLLFSSVFLSSHSWAFWGVLYILLNTDPVPFGSRDSINSKDPRNGGK